MKTILITGASSGIGKTTALYFQAKGWNVIATMRKPELDTELNLPNIVKLRLDVTDSTSIQEAIRESILTFNTIDVLLNNAGYGTLGVFEGSTTEQTRHLFETNVIGMMDVTRAILPHFRKNKKGTIINISSVAGKVAVPLFNVYNSSKFAVEGFSESLFFELEPFNIKVKLIQPGPIKTDFFGRSMDTFDASKLPEYHEKEQSVMDYYMKSGQSGLPPISVAKRIYKAATDQNKQFHYPVGLAAVAMIFASWILPRCLLRIIIKLAIR